MEHWRDNQGPPDGLATRLRYFTCFLARNGDLFARCLCHQHAVIEDGNQAEPHADHARRIGTGGIMNASKLSTLGGGSHQLLVDTEDLRLFTIEHRLEAERKAEVARADIDAADAGHVQNSVNIVDRLLRLDHRDHQHFVIGDRLVRARLAIGGGADRAGAALALGRIQAIAYQGPGFGLRVDHRADHAPGAAVQNLADDAGLVPGNPHQWRDRVPVHRLEALHHRLIVLHAVLDVDGHAVPAALRHYLGREAGRDGEPGVHASLARFQTRLEFVHHVFLGLVNTGVSAGLPAKCARRLSTVRSPMALRVSCVALATCGCSTTWSMPNSASGTWGSDSNTSRPAAPRLPSASALTSACSSTTDPRATLISVPSGPRALSTSALTMWCVAAPPGQITISTSQSRAISVRLA